MRGHGRVDFFVLDHEQHHSRVARRPLRPASPAALPSEARTHHRPSGRRPPMQTTDIGWTTRCARRPSRVNGAEEFLCGLHPRKTRVQSSLLNIRICGLRQSQHCDGMAWIPRRGHALRDVVRTGRCCAAPAGLPARRIAQVCRATASIVRRASVRSATLRAARHRETSRRRSGSVSGLAPCGFRARPARRPAAIACAHRGGVRTSRSAC